MQVDDDLMPVPTGASSLTFLAHSASEALMACPHPWWKLTGLRMAPDLADPVQAKLEEAGRSLVTWLRFGLETEDPYALTCRAMWPGYDLDVRRPVDAYWLTTRPETMRRVLGGLTEPQVNGLMGRPAEPVGVLVDRKGRVLRTEEPDYPVANQWNAYSPFVEIKPISVYTLTDLWEGATRVERLRPLGLS